MQSQQQQQNERNGRITGVTGAVVMQDLHDASQCLPTNVRIQHVL